MLAAFMQKNRLPESFKQLVNDSYLPLAEKIVKKYQQQGSPYFIGINGCQGSGKSTLSDYICNYISNSYQLNVVVMSLDDFYLSRTARATLAQTIHPLLKTRGVPGTHNTQLLHEVIAHIKEQKSHFLIPRFNKATDDPYAKSEWQIVDKPIDILILEGWCWGVTAQSEAQLLSPVNTLEKEQDEQRIWRTYVNQQLMKYYQPLYEFFDYWVALQVPSFNTVYNWRLEQEQKLIQSLPENQPSNVMNEEEILQFIQYFQRLTTHGMQSLPLLANSLYTLDKQRNITQCIEKSE